MVRNLLEFPRGDSKPNPSTYNCDGSVTDSCFGGFSMQNQVHTQSATHPTSAAGVPMPNAQALHVSTGVGYRGSELAADLLTRLFRRLPMSLTLRLWNGAAVRVGADSGAQESPFALVFLNPEVVSTAVL